MMHVVIDQEILVPWKCSDKKILFVTRKNRRAETQRDGILFETILSQRQLPEFRIYLVNVCFSFLITNSEITSLGVNRVPVGLWLIKFPVADVLAFSTVIQVVYRF